MEEKKNAARKAVVTAAAQPLQPRPEFIMLMTGTRDNDNAVGKIAGCISVVSHKLCYVPPYERFDELRKLQLRIRRSPASVGKKICAAIELCEWVGHENEDYFNVAVKFFHDMCGRMKFVFTVGDCTREEAAPLYLKLRMYMNGKISEDPTFRSTVALAEYIVSRVADKNAASLIADMLMRDEMKELRSYPAVDRLCYDMRAGSSTGVITAAEVSALLSDVNSLPSLVDRKTALEFAALAEEISPKLPDDHDAA